MPNIHVLIKPASGMCNLRCQYCFYHDEMKNRETESYGFMAEETLERVIRETLAYSDTACTIAYQGESRRCADWIFFVNPSPLKSSIIQKEFTFPMPSGQTAWYLTENGQLF